MLKECFRALTLFVFLSAVTGLLYPVAMTGFAQTVFPEQANGSLVSRDGSIVGSSLVGQGFVSEEYFHGRPSAAGSNGYDALASSGSNMGPTNRSFLERAALRVEAVRKLNKMSDGSAVPSDLVLASGSGLDPHISLRSAMLQVDRIASVRGISPAAVRAVVLEQTEGAIAGFMGEQRVNVLKLNLDLDEKSKDALR